MRTLVCILILSVVSFSSGAVFACSTSPLPDLVMDADSPVVEFDAFTVTADIVQRERYQPNYSNSCEGLARVFMKISNGNPEVGYTLEIVKGEMPPGFIEPTSPVVSYLGDQLYVHWWDVDFTPVDLILRVTAVAPNGDVGPYQDVRIWDGEPELVEDVEGTEMEAEDDGCSSTGSRGVGGFALLLFGLLFVRGKFA